jgi:hypothetical protein
MLSAILQKLHELKNGSIQAERQLALIDLCVSAFPDVRPWQVRKACIDGKNSLQELQPLYYTYLSLLLHPTDGHDNARNDGVLVKVKRKFYIKIPTDFHILLITPFFVGRTGMVRAIHHQYGRWHIRWR